MTDCQPPPKNARILIVEDDPVVREHFTEIVSQAANLDIAGVASSIAEFHRLEHLEPDLFLLDVGLPDGSGLDLIPKIKNRSQAKILIISSFGDRETVVQALQSGADGYLLKDSRADTLLDGIEVTMQGGAPISATAAVFLLDQLRTGPLVKADIDVDNGLTPREVEVLQIFSKGSSYKETARALEISPLTVGNHVKSIYRKLAVNSRGEAVYEAVKTGQLKI